MEKVITFLKSIPKGERADWARKHGMDPVRISQIVGGHKGIGLEYAAKIIGGSDGRVVLQDFIDPPEGTATPAQHAAA
jgi:hypothetical protein